MFERITDTVGSKLSSSNKSRSSMFLGQRYDFNYFSVNLCAIDENRQTRLKLNKELSITESLSVLQERPYVVQIQDVSGRMLYTEAHAKSRYASMMQASVSHELLNPLASMIYQFNNLRDEILQLIQVCTFM